MGRVHVGDIFAHIAQELRLNNGGAQPCTVDELLTSFSFNLRLSVTDDLESTEHNYLERYGEGRTFYFRLVDYEHGKTLAKGIYQILLGKAPDMNKHTGEQFPAESELYLFLHVSNVVPRPAVQLAEESGTGI